MRIPHLHAFFDRVHQTKRGRAARRHRNRSVLAIEVLEARQLLASTVAVQSGNWSNPGTWNNGVPDATSRAIIGQGMTVTLDGLSSVTKELVIQGVLNVAEGTPGSAARALSSDWVSVNSGGVFQIGTAANRYDAHDFVLTLTGTDPNADFSIETVMNGMPMMMNVVDNNGFLMTDMGGSLQFFGEQKLSFTKLAATASVGSISITVANVIERNFNAYSTGIVTSAANDGSLNWEVGDRIAIASSHNNYNQQEVRTITGITDQGANSVLTLNSPLAYRHYGEIETYSNATRSWDIDMRAEVALLSRTIKIQGTQDTDVSFGDRANYGTTVGKNLGIGGHAMFMPGSGTITVDSVQFDKMGQTGRVGRYPIHWHLGADRTGDVLRNSSVTNANNRGVVVHGSHNILLEGNVLHDIHGHGFFLEDGVERGNRFIANIALGIHRVRSTATSTDPFTVPGVTRGGDGRVNGEAPRNGNGESSHDTGQNVVNRFRHSAAYWITNPDNTWVGNVSAGSQGTGFWFALPNAPIGLSRDTGLYNGVDAARTNLRKFDYNTTHSAPIGLTFDRGSDIQPGATNHYDPPQRMRVNYLTAYKHPGTAVYHRASDGLFNESRFADNANSSFNTFNQEERNVLFVGNSRGNANTSSTAVVGGFRLYDGPGLIINSHFAGFAAANAHMFRVESGANKHAHTLAQGITYEDDGTTNHLSIEWLTSDPDDLTTINNPTFVSGRPDSWSGIVLDADGSLTGVAGGGVNSVLVPKIDYFRDSNDIAPAGWNAYLSNDRFAQLKIGTIGGGILADYRIENGDGNAVVANVLNIDTIQRQYAKLNAGDYTINFIDPVPAAGWELILETLRGGVAGDSTVFRFPNVAAGYKPNAGALRNSLAALRSANSTSYYRDYNGDLWIKIFASTALQVVPTADPLPPNPQSAYLVRTVTNGTRIEAEAYDNGGPNIAYFDTTAGNAGSTTFRTTENVDVQTTTDVGGGFNVSSTANGEWLEYTADVVAGVYDIGFRVASAATSAKSLRVLVGNGGSGGIFSELGVIAVPETGGTQSWTTLTLKGADLSTWGGTRRVFRIEIIGGPYNLNWMQFTRSQAAYTQRTVTHGTRIEAEAYDIGGPGFAYSDTSAGNMGSSLRMSDDVDVYKATDTGGGSHIGDIANGEWLEYTTDVVAGTYNISFRLATPTAGTLRLLIADDETATALTLLGTVTVPVTGSFTTWQTVTLSNVNLSAWQGTGRVMRLEMVSGPFNLNWFEFAAAPTVQSVAINNGVSSQRSAITSLQVTFNTLVTAPAAAFSITNRGIPSGSANSAVGGLVVSSANVSGQTVVNITFNAGANVLVRSSGGNTLIDGNYRLNINGAMIQATSGGAMMASNYVYGANPVDEFFRLYGDHNGDGFVDFNDFASGFLPAFGTSSATSGFASHLDSDGDGDVDFDDFATGFLPRFGQSR